jgi:hypothetical protein
MINKTTYGNVKNILIGQDSFHIALPIKLSGTANQVIKAGEVLSGDLEKRLSTEFTVTTDMATGLLLHEVVLDANGKGNGTIVVAGCIDKSKLDSDVLENITIAKTDLTNIIITEGSAI